MATIGNLVVHLTANTQPLAQGMARARGVISGLGDQVGGLIRRFGPLTAAVGGLTAAIRGSLAVSRQFGEIDSLAKFARTVGRSASELVGLEHAANLSGVEIATLRKGLQVAAREGIQLEDLADQMAALEDPVQRAQLAYESLSEEGQNLIPLLMQGSAAIREMVEEGARLAGFEGVDAEQIEAANDAVARMKLAFTGVARQLAISLAPAVERIANLVRQLAPAFSAIGRAALDTVLPIVEPILKVAAGVAQWVASLRGLIPVIRSVVIAIGTLVAAQRAVAAAQSVVLALSGPKGWAVLAAGAAIGAAAYVGVSRAFDDLTESVEQATAAAESANRTFEQGPDADFFAGIAQETERVRDRIASINDEIELLSAPEHLKGITAINQELRKLEDAGVPASLVDRLRQVMQIRNRLQATQEREREDEARRLQEREALRSRAEQLRSEVATPVEQLQERVGEIRKLLAEGALLPVDADRLLADAEQRLRDLQEEELQIDVRAPERIDFGLTGAQQQAIDLFTPGATGESAEEKQLRELEKLNEANDEQRRFLRDMLTALRNEIQHRREEPVTI